MEFYVALVTSGALTPRLFALNIGDRLWLGPKITGMFTFDQVPEDQNVVMIATGTGLAPYMSMLTTHLICGGPRRFAVLHGARHSWDLGYRSELLTLQHLCKNFSYSPVISRPQSEPVPWQGAGWLCPGPVEERRDCPAMGPAPSPDNTHVFLCGSPQMIDDTVAMLQNRRLQGTHEERTRPDPRRAVLVGFVARATSRSARTTQS